MDEKTVEVETCQLSGLWVPTSLVDLVEKWANRTRENATDVLRSILNLGLAHYVEMYPQSVPQLAKAMEDLDAMAPQGAKRYRLDAVERADGHLALRCAEEGEPDAVKVEAAAQPKLAALLKAHAARLNGPVGDMLLGVWCAATLDHYHRQGKKAMVAAILEAWEEQGIPELMREHVTNAAEAFWGRELDSIE